MNSQQNSDEEAKSAVYRSEPNQSVKIQSVSITGAGNVSGSVVQSGDMTIKNIAQVGKDASYFEVTSKTIESLEKVRKQIIDQAEVLLDRGSRQDLMEAVDALCQVLQQPRIDEKKIYFLLNSIGELSSETLEIFMKWVFSQDNLPPHFKDLASRALASAKASAKRTKRR